MDEQITADYLQQYNKDFNSIGFLPIIRINDKICTITGAKHFITEGEAIAFAEDRIAEVEKALKEQNIKDWKILAVNLGLSNEVKEKRIEELEDKIEQISQWCEAYPVDIFPEPDFKKAARVLKENGLTIDSISASNMRHVLDGVRAIIEGK